MPKYDYLIVGAGFFGSVFAYQATKKGKRCLILDRRQHIGGHCYTPKINGVPVHIYGPHIFHTSNEEVWNFVNQFTTFNHFINQPIAYVDGQVYNLPFNMNLFSRIFGAIKPDDVSIIIDKERQSYANLVPTNLEEQAIKMVGTTIYEKFIKGYTEKQWGKKCTELPPEVIKRLPLRFIYDNNYYNDKYQGVPTDGYTPIFEKMLKDIDVKTDTGYKDVIGKVEADNIIYTGMIDEYFNYQYGALEYRSLDFMHTVKETYNYQGVAVINYPSIDIPYTRSIEHRHFYDNVELPVSVVSYEFSKTYRQNLDLEASYPIGDTRNLELYSRYLKLSESVPHIYFCGRLGNYKYFDMDDTIESSLALSKKLL